MTNVTAGSINAILFILQEFIDTLDSATVKKLCIRSRRRGIGSMDYIDSVLIMDDGDKDAEVYSPAAEAGVEM